MIRQDKMRQCMTISNVKTAGGGVRLQGGKHKVFGEQSHQSTNNMI